MTKYAKAGDAGLDLTATNHYVDEYDNDVYHTGVSVKIPDGYVGLLFPRSSNSKKDLLLTNSVGVIDSGYTGELILKYRRAFLNSVFNSGIYEVGDRVAQLVITPVVTAKLVQVDALPTTERGTGSYGSTGK
jgi:dUTP pyrophosphatase